MREFPIDEPRDIGKKRVSVSSDILNKVQYQENIIEIEEEIQINDEVILEVGDRIQVITEEYGEDEAWDIEIDLRDARQANEILMDRKFIDDVKVVQTYTNAYRVFGADMLEEVIDSLEEFDIEYEVKEV